MHKTFFNEIIYSSSNEDSESEKKALCLTDNDVLLCITGSGARPLDLLIENPEKIVSVDFNETQNHLLELKMAAYKVFTYSEFCHFIGLKDSSNRVLDYKILSGFLSSKAKTYWDDNLDLIEKGILYIGKWESSKR
jgi:S-adenosylmethionine-diacylglycerol 3-amino-3-carboxypropyl transferase